MASSAESGINDQKEDTLGRSVAVALKAGAGFALFGYFIVLTLTYGGILIGQTWWFWWWIVMLACFPGILAAVAAANWEKRKSHNGKAARIPRGAQT
jgi:hypothetical protein